jgi:chromosome segregation ATPase
VTWGEAAALITALVAALVFGANELRKSAAHRRQDREKIERAREKERAELEAMQPNATRAWQEIYNSIRAEREAIRAERDEMRQAAEEIRRACQSEITALKEEHGRERDSWEAERARLISERAADHARWVDERAEMREELEELRTLVQTLRHGPQALDPPGGQQ